MAPGPASSGVVASGEAAISPAAMALVWDRRPLRLSRAMRNRIIPPAILKPLRVTPSTRKISVTAVANTKGMTVAMMMMMMTTESFTICFLCS